MWNYGNGSSIGDALGALGLGRGVVKPLLKLFLIGVVIAGLIYAYVVFKAVSGRSEPHHVHAHSTH
ncbi:cobalt-zinc-cadmium resistance efflux pump [Terriglobus saanensis SP1PR4]|uniref:Cobalt-zinc-cadmium resistance efflux pump n=1 Tax=Terriglobus saanensis (strain ATCC BAA-1853 / DSM 23119 / SP1PR4) TaxID=401053 RepID=E8V521_TERSS|nr:cobalt-zinc-cadmium resistance efflux pump [Terriglobus saanensis SP1PR4]